MSQLSFLSADFDTPELTDLGGILAAHGQLTVSGGAGRLSVLVPHEWRAVALADELRRRDVPVEPVALTDDQEWWVRTERTDALLPLAAAWTRGAVKSVPAGLRPSPGMVRSWALAAGRLAEVDEAVILGLDPRAPDTHEPLAAALRPLGLAPTKVGVRSGGDGLKITGRARLARLADLVGQPPAGAHAWGGTEPGEWGI